MAFEVTLVPKENIELGVTQKAVFTLTNVTPTIPVPGPVGPQGPPGPQGPQGLPGTGVNSTDDVPEGDVNLYYTEERVEAVIAVTPPAPHTHSASDITDFKDSIATILKAGTDITIDNNPGDITINADIPAVTDSSDGLMTSALKLKLDGIASGAEVNVNADWNATSGDAQILNKPTIVSSVGATAPITSSGGTNPTISTSMASNRLIGRTTAGIGVMEEISIGTGLQLSAGTLTNTIDSISVVKHTVKNNGAAVINKGTPVYSTGSDGTNILVAKASNASESTSSKTMGLTQTQLTTSGSNQTGFVITEGLLGGLDTQGATAGDPVWLGVDGALIYGLANKPYAPAHLVFLGIVTKVSAGNGEIFVKVQNGFELQEIHNVDLVTTTPVNGHILGYNGTLWVNKTIATWLGYTPENVANKSDSYTVSSSTTYATTKAVVDGLATKLNTSLKGASNGLAELDGSGKVPTSQLPSYVDDVLEYANIGALPATGSAGIIYVTLDDNKIYRWSGTAYTVISDTIALGETSATAYRGDRGKISYDHSQIITGNPHGTTKSDIGLGNVDNTSDANKPVSTATQTALNLKVDANTAITGATKTKITYDSKGLVTAGADATTADIAESTNKLYVSDGDKGDITVSGNGTTWTIDAGAVTLADMANLASGNIIGRTDAGSGAPQAITIGTGLTGSASTLTANLSVGVNNGQLVIGGARASENLTLSSTSDATKGKIIFGTSAYDEANDRLGIGTTSPTNTFHISKNITASSGSALVGLVNGTLTASANADTLNGLNINLTFANGAYTSVNNYLQTWSNAGTLRSFVRWDGLQQWDMVNTSNVNVGRIQYGYPSGNAGMAIFDWDTTNNVYFNRYNIANEGTFFYQGFHNTNNLGGMALFNTTHNLVIGYTGTPTDSGFKLDVNGTSQFQNTVNLNTLAVNGRESLLVAKVSDNSNDQFGIFNATSTANRFVPTFMSYSPDTYGALVFRSLTLSAGDSGTGTLVTIQTAITNSSTDPNNGTFSNIATRPLFRIQNANDEQLKMFANGNVVIQTGGTLSDSGFKLDVNGTIRAQGDFTISTKNIITDTTTGTKIGTATSQKLAFWNKTPIVQPTTAIAQAAFVQVNTTNAVSDASTFGGYTLRQIAQALINIGILA